MLKRIAALLTAVGIVLVPPLVIYGRSPSATVTSYTVIDLGTLGGLSAQATDINEASHVVGYATTASSGARAFLWRNGVMTDLGVLNGNRSQAEGVNEADQVVGSSTISLNSVPHPVLWEGGAKIDLTPSGAGIVANAINDSRQVVGSLNNGNAFLWANNVLSDLGNLGGGGAGGTDINNIGQVVGSSYTRFVGSLGPLTHAFLWQNGVGMTDLGVLPGDEDSAASAINELGQVTGSSMRTDPETYENNSHSFIYSGGSMTALPVPSAESYASDINDSGQVVGSMRAPGGFSKYHAYIYSAGVVTDLNNRLANDLGLHLTVATAINNAGEIVGWAYDAQGRNHAFLLRPASSNPLPRMTIDSVSKNEGNSGSTVFTFTVSLSAASSTAVTVNFATADGSARAPDDYAATSGVLTFNPGETTRTVNVSVKGDKKSEYLEVFYVNLSGASGAILESNRGTGAIQNDDR
jgi:probable HAF family extracellular repeat protein